MKYNTLGNTGVLVSEICLGTMTFGGRGYWKAIGEQSQDEVNALVKNSLDKGVNFIDTANVYSEGLSEICLGKALSDLGVNRQDVVLATKLRGRMGEGVNQVGLSRLHIADSIADSLKRLQVEHIDLLYIHGVDALTPLEETMRGLEDAVRSGRVRYLGISNHPAWMVAKANGIAAKMDWTLFTGMQIFYSLACREAEHELMPMALSENLAVMPWSPLAGGFLTGRFTRKGNQVGGARRDSFDFPPINKERAFDIIDVMATIGQQRGVSVSQVALAWLRQKPGVTSTIIGAKTNEQLLDNLASIDLILDDAEMSRLDTVSALVPEYPSWMLERQGAGRRPS